MATQNIRTTVKEDMKTHTMRIAGDAAANEPIAPTD